MTVSADRYTLDELVGRVADDLGRLELRQDNGQVSAVPDGRTLRYYSSLGLLDRPIETRGRRAYYGPRHVLQAVAIKTLQAEGLALQDIQQLLTGRSDEELRRLAGRTPVARFWREPPTAGVATPVPQHRPPPGPPPAPDVPPAHPADRTGAVADPPSRAAGPDPTAATTAPQGTALAGSRTGAVRAEPAAVRLGPDAVLLLEPVRDLDADDRRAIRAAAETLLATLDERGLLPTDLEGT